MVEGRHFLFLLLLRFAKALSIDSRRQQGSGPMARKVSSLGVILRGHCIPGALGATCLGVTHKLGDPISQAFQASICRFAIRMPHQAARMQIHLGDCTDP